jgi:dihydrofolate synthase/folylpolyglutamate synthase
VSHNAQAAQALADALHQLPLAGRCYAILGMMRDKDVAAFVQPLLASVDVWYVTGLQVDRASSAVELAARIEVAAAEAPVVVCTTVTDALAKLKMVLTSGDRVLVCGSFYTVAEWSALRPEFTDSFCTP